MADYVLAEGPKDLGLEGPVLATPLRALFGDHDTLFVYHMMFHPDDDAACPMCSMWVDGLHGVAQHLTQHTAFVVIAKAPLPKLRMWALRRGWDGLRILSSFGTTFNADMSVETPEGAQRPVVSVFRKEADPDGGHLVRHLISTPANFADGAEGAIDLLSPVWNVLDMLPAGRGDWYADNSYAGGDRG
jgi:predicted dithiol-disulfide oxidoreductase (DUF899 family)